MSLLTLIFLAIIVYLIYRSLRDIIRDAFGSGRSSYSRNSRVGYNGRNQAGQQSFGRSRTRNGANRERSSDTSAHNSEHPISKGEGEYVDFEEV